MQRFRSQTAALSTAFLLLSLGTALAHGQSTRGGDDLRLLDHVTEYHSLPDGIDLRSGGAREQITALRDDVLRIRITRGSSLPEDASWAVLPESRRSSVKVTPESTGDRVGFHTDALRVEIDKNTMALTVSDLEAHVIQKDSKPARFEGDTFRLYKAMGHDEHFFGLGDKTGPLDRRNEAFTLWNTDAYRFQESTDPIYKAIPFFMTYDGGRAAGVLLDNTWRSSFDFGKASADMYSFGAANGPVDYYVMYGPSPKQVVESYAWLTGKPPLPPMWMLGFQQSRYTYVPQSRVLEIADHLRADHIPADALYLDIDFQDRNRPFTVDTKLFPDFTGMIDKLKAENFHVVAITDLHIANAPHQDYAPYDSGIAGDQFVKNPDGSVFTGIVWPGPSVFPDFTQQQTRAWWSTLYKEFVHDGVAGFWNDMNEPSVFNTPSKTMPEDVVHRIDEPGFAKRTATHAEIHNMYGMENSRATFEGLLKLDPNTRPFVLTRASYAGGQRYAATWTGDNSASWNHLRMTTPMIENLGLSGFSFSGADVGGFAGSPQMDLLTKWLEIAAFQPIDRDHSEKGTADQEPWAGGSEQETIRKRFIEERYHLLPYLYTLADETSRTGLPMVRPLFLEFPHAFPDSHPMDVDPAAAGEFLLGGDLLIAPPHYPDELDSYSVEFPSRDWYDYWTGEKIPVPVAVASTNSPQPVDPNTIAPLTIQVKPELASLPVYVRAGAILPMQPLVQSTNETPKGPLTLRVYAGEAGSPCSGELYLDDGKSFAYQHGEYLRMKFSCEVTADGLRLHIGAHEGSYPAWWKEIRAEFYGLQPKQYRAAVKGREVTAEQSAAHISVEAADDAKGLDIEVK
ncbi:TIM-barrel domain-containing protein [Acidobacterium sp. S8]|uniref:glycoside hydrolase family 31 protein n=1 Tax=Acidobacterium sp. S8 TaxID=1641854 RepID=UPI00131ADD34|nr:TIM-barrel domain-containing protein [Acidobacterium sp. S8]